MYSIQSVSIPLTPDRICLHVSFGPDLVQDGVISGPDNAVLNKSHADPPGRPQLFPRCIKPVALQLKAVLGGGVHSTCRDVQLPVREKILHTVDTHPWRQEEDLTLSPLKN